MWTVKVAYIMSTLRLFATHTTMSYQPSSEPCVVIGIPKDIIASSSTSRSSVRPGDQKSDIEGYAYGYGPVLLPLFPITRVEAFREPEPKVKRIEPGADAFKQWSPTDKPWHAR